MDKLWMLLPAASAAVSWLQSLQASLQLAVQAAHDLWLAGPISTYLLAPQQVVRGGLGGHGLPIHDVQHQPKG